MEEELLPCFPSVPGRPPLLLASALGMRAWLHFELLFIKFLVDAEEDAFSLGLPISMCAGFPLSHAPAMRLIPSQIVGGTEDSRGASRGTPANWEPCSKRVHPLPHGFCSFQGFFLQMKECSVTSLMLS